RGRRVGVGGRHGVAVNARVGVEDRPVDVDRHGPEHRLRHAREHLVSRAERPLVRNRVVVGPGHLAQPKRQMPVHRRLASLSLQYLLKNVLKISTVEGYHCNAPEVRSPDWWRVVLALLIDRAW